MAGTIGALWGVAGVLLFLGSAVCRLARSVGEATTLLWHWHHAATLVVVVAGMAYAEGYRGFQQTFAPRVGARARYLRTRPVWGHILFAPLFCMGFFHTTRRRQIMAFMLTGGIVVLIVLVRLLPQPWRGILDAGVVVGLGWGMAAVAGFAWRALTATEFSYSPEVPANTITEPVTPAVTRAKAG